jgi:hypothetical protein
VFLNKLTLIKKALDFSKAFKGTNLITNYLPTTKKYSEYFT